MTTLLAALGDDAEVATAHKRAQEEEEVSYSLVVRVRVQQTTVEKKRWSRKFVFLHD